MFASQQQQKFNNKNLKTSDDITEGEKINKKVSQCEFQT